MEAVFLKLLNMSITASWLVVAVVLLRLVLKKAPKIVSLILWALVGVRLILPISLESVFSLIPSAQTFPSDFTTSTAPTIQTGIPIFDSNINQIIPQAPAPSIQNGTQIFNPSTDPIISQSPGTSASATPLETIVFIASIVWVAGVAVMLLYALISYIRLKLRVREAVKSEGNIMLCDSIASPFILGIIRPKIYIPSSIDAQDVYYVLAHENAHLKRRDHFWKPLGFFLLSIYWFNPVLWVAYILLCRDIELACDEKVIKDLGIEAKKPYSTALVNCSISHKAITVCPLAFGEVGVKRRVKTVLNYKKPTFWIIIVALVICAVVAVCFLTNPPSDDNTTTTTNPNTTTTTTTTQPTTSDNLVKKAELKNYIGYWYLEDVTQKADELTISYIELYVKNVEDDVVTFDYSFGTWCGEDIKVLLTEGKSSCYGDAEIVMPFKDMYGKDNAIGGMNLRFSKDSDTGNYMIYVRFDGSVAEGSLDFAFKSPVQIEVPQISFGENYNLDDYIGDWYDDTGEPDDDWPIQNELHIKQVNGNMVTFDYVVAMLCGEDDITVEVVNNIGRFRTDESMGIIIFKEDSIELRTMYMYYGYTVDGFVMTYKHVS